MARVAGSGSELLPSCSTDAPLDHMQVENKCPRCGEGRLRSWSELNEEERELVRRLPSSADYSLDQRKAMHRWCSRCWYESTSGTGTLA